MPLLLRAAHVEDVPSGESRVVKVRGTKVRLVHVGEAWHAFEAGSAPMAAQVTEADLAWAQRNAAVPFRVLVRGSHVYVALEADPWAAPATVHGRDGAPTPVPAGSVSTGA